MDRVARALGSTVSILLHAAGISVTWILIPVYGIEFVSIILTMWLTVDTALVALLIQNHQNTKDAVAEKRDVAMHQKLDHIILRLPETDNSMAHIEEEGNA